MKITVTDCPDEQRTAVEVQVGDRVRDECVVETGLPPIQADQLGPGGAHPNHRNGQLLFEGGYTAEHDMGWYDLEETGIPLPCPFPIAALLETITGSIMKRIEGRFSALPVGRSW